MIQKIKLEDAISHVSYNHQGGYAKGTEFLSGEYVEKNGGVQFIHHHWTPSERVVSSFKRIIGNKWHDVSLRGTIGKSLSETAIVIDGNFILARGGLCPGGVRLFEIDSKGCTLDQIVNRYKWGKQ